MAALAQARSEVTSTLRTLAAAGVVTAVVKHPPGPWPMPVPVCVAASPRDYDPCALPRAPMTGHDVLTTFAERHPALTQTVSLDRFVCDERLCHGTIGGVVAYSDESHLSTTFTRTLAPALSARLDPIMPSLRRRATQRGS